MIWTVYYANITKEPALKDLLSLQEDDRDFFMCWSSDNQAIKYTFWLPLWVSLAKTGRVIERVQHIGVSRGEVRTSAVEPAALLAIVSPDSGRQSSVVPTQVGEEGNYYKSNWWKKINHH